MRLVEAVVAAERDRERETERERQRETERERERERENRYCLMDYACAAAAGSAAPWQLDNRGGEQFFPQLFIQYL